MIPCVQSLRYLHIARPTRACPKKRKTCGLDLATKVRQGPKATPDELLTDEAPLCGERAKSRHVSASARARDDPTSMMTSAGEQRAGQVRRSRGMPSDLRRSKEKRPVRGSLDAELVPLIAKVTSHIRRTPESKSQLCQIRTPLAASQKSHFVSSCPPDF